MCQLHNNNSHILGTLSILDLISNENLEYLERKGKERRVVYFLNYETALLLGLDLKTNYLVT